MIPDAVLDQAGFLHEETEFHGVFAGASGAAGDHPLDCFGAYKAAFKGGKTKLAVLDGDIFLKVLHELLQIEPVGVGGKGETGHGSGGGRCVWRIATRKAGTLEGGEGMLETRSGSE